MKWKKCLISLFIALIAASSAFAADVSKLYRVKNSTVGNISEVLEAKIKNKYPSVIKKQNSYILNNGEYFYQIIISAKDGDCYFYYMSNDENEDFRQELLELMKASDLKPKRVFKSSLNSFFYGEAYTNLSHSNVKVHMKSNKKMDLTLPDMSYNNSNVTIDYDFSDEAQAKFDNSNNLNPNNIKSGAVYYEKPIELTLQNSPGNSERAETKEDLPYNASVYNSMSNSKPQLSQQRVPLEGNIVFVNDGTSFTAMLLSDISSDSITNNDRISAELDADWMSNGKLIAPKGSILSGRAIDTKAASFAMANGQIGLLFDELMTPDGNIINLKTNKVYITGNSSRALNVTKRIAGGAATGLILSAISMLWGRDPMDAVITGVAIGAAGGAISTVITKGEEVRIMEGSQLQIIITEPLTVPAYNF